MLAILLGKNFVWWDLNILTGSPWVTMKSSTTSLIRGYPWILSLGAINAQTSTRDLVLSGHNMINCLSLYSKGHITVVINGKILLDEEISFFRNSYNVRPMSLAGKKKDKIRKLLNEYVCVYNKSDLFQRRHLGRFWLLFFLLYSLYSCLKKLVLYNLDLVPLLFRC